MPPKGTSQPQGERLQKVMANLGLGSRRQIEGWIKEGRIKINGVKAVLGVRVEPKDQLTLNDHPVRQRRTAEERYVIVYNKPEGEIVSRQDEKDRKTVFKNLPRLKQGRWIAVGRLDINSSGLLLLTNDGELANRLMHPSQQIEREYAIRVLGQVTNDMLKQLVTGVELEDGLARFEDIVPAGGEGSNHWYHLVIMEGRKREVRRLWEAIGVTVSRLKRVRFGPVILGSKVKAGQWRELDKEEREALLQSVKIKDKKPWGELNRSRSHARNPPSPYKAPKRKAPQRSSQSPWRQSSPRSSSRRRS